MLATMAWRPLVACAAFLLTGCFSDPQPAPAECVDGASGCSCYGNGTCDESLVCNTDNNCVATDCQDGRLECPCYGNGTCDSGLVCTSNICQPQSTGGTGVPGSTGTTSMSGTSMSSVGVDTGEPETTSRGDSSSGAPMTSTSGPDPVCDCPSGQVCLPPSLACVDSPYVPCSAGVCSLPMSICASEGVTGSICAPSCGAAAECPAVPGAMPPECTEGGGCVIPCEDATDCSWLRNGTCQSDSNLGLSVCVTN